MHLPKFYLHFTYKYQQCTKCSSNILLCLIRFSLHLSLYQRCHSILLVYHFSITVKTTKLVLLRFHVLYLSTAARLMFTERLQFWDTPGLQSVYEICTVTIFFYSDQKNTKWKGIFHIKMTNLPFERIQLPEIIIWPMVVSSTF